MRQTLSNVIPNRNESNNAYGANELCCFRFTVTFPVYY